MGDVRWIKLATDIFDNRKIKQIEKMPEGDSIIVIWIKLLCLAGHTNDNGYVYLTQEIPYTEDMLATEFNRPLQVVRLALTTFQKFGMIELIDDIYHVSSWAKYQNIDGMERIREQGRQRVERYRSKQKALTGNVTGNVTVTQSNALDKEVDKEKEREEDLEKEIDVRGGTGKRFSPPTRDEVQAYCEERENGIDADRFIDFYESKGWMVGENKMKDWKAAVRTWEKRNSPPDRRGQAAEELDAFYSMMGRWAEE